MKKYAQIVYTRCHPGRNMDGTPCLEDGYGVYSLSRELVERNTPGDAKFQAGMLESKSRDKRDAYLLWVPKSGPTLLVFHHYRKADESTRGFSRDSNVAVLQGFAGEFDRYPCEAFGSAGWTDWKRSWTDYYSDDKSAPALLEPVEEDVLFGDETAREQLRARVADFIRDGRQEALRKAVWFVLNQAGGPQQRALMILDTEENVELWVAAIEFALPVRTAQRVSFSTSVTNANLGEGYNAYYLNPTNGEFARGVSQAIYGGVQYRTMQKALIFGVDPQDDSASCLRTPRPDSNYVVLDGAAREAKFEAGEGFSAEYYRCIGDLDDPEHVEVCLALHENLRAPEPNAELPELYDAARRICRTDAWQYTALLHDIQRLEPKLQEGCVLDDIIERNLCEKYADLFREDMRNGWKLLSYLWQHADCTPDHSYRDSAAKIAADCLLDCVRGGDSKLLSGFVDALRKCDSQLYVRALDGAMGEGGIRQLKKLDMSVVRPDLAARVIALLVDSLNHRGQDVAAALTSKTNEGLLRKLLARVIEDRAECERLLLSMAKDVDAVMALVEMGGTLASPAARRELWQAAAKVPQVSLSELCDLIADLGMDEDIEELLSSRMTPDNIASSRAMDEIVRIFAKHCGKQPGAGNNFYTAWCECALRAKNRAVAVDVLLNHLPRDKSSLLLSDLYRKLDGVVKLNLEPDTLEMARRIGQGARLDGLTAVRAELVTFTQRMLDAVAEPKPRLRGTDRSAADDRILKLCAQTDYRISACAGFAASRLCSELLERVFIPSESPAIHLVGLSLFDFDSQPGEQDAYYARYARLVADRNRAALYLAVAEAMLICRDPTAYRGKPRVGEILSMSGLEPRTLEECANGARLALIAAIGKGKLKDGFVQKVVNVAQDKSPRAGDLLEMIFDEARDYYEANRKRNGFVSIVKGIFGKK